MVIGVNGKNGPQSVELALAETKQEIDGVMTRIALTEDLIVQVMSLTLKVSIPMEFKCNYIVNPAPVKSRVILILEINYSQQIY